MGEDGVEERWIFGSRFVAGIPVDRARLRTTLAYRITPALQAGLEYNPLDDDLGIIANWRAIDETEHRPALLVGTSSDRIGTDSGRSYYATLSKDLEGVLDLPIAPYAGIAYGEFDDELVGVGGLSVRWADDVTSYHMWDGHNLHHVVEKAFGRHSVGLMLVDLDGEYYAGLTYSVSFSMPWER